MNSFNSQRPTLGDVESEALRFLQLQESTQTKPEVCSQQLFFAAMFLSQEHAS